MGHSYAEMDPRGAQEQHERLDREMTLKRNLEDIPLSFFTVKDFVPLLYVSGFDVHKRPWESHLTQLEGKVEQWQALQMGQNEDETNQTI